MYFDRHFFKESLRQTRGMGIFFVSVAFLVSCFYPAVKLIGHLQERDAATELISISEMAQVLPYVCLIFAVLIPLKLFGFLFKRGSSDFYHALPFKRQTIYFSNLAVILFWYALGLVLTLGGVSLIYAVDPVVVMKPSFFFLSLLVHFILMLMVSGAVLVSSSVTGKKSLAAMVGLMIVFLPRAIFYLALESVYQKTGLIVTSAVKFFSYKYSLVYSLVINGDMSMSSTEEAFAFVPGMVCSAIVGIILVVAGAWLFCIRKSETAENAVPNRILDAVLQISYSIIFFFAAVSIYFTEEGSSDDYEFFAFLFFCFIGFMVFVLYEAIYSKSIKKIIKSLPRLGIVAALTLAYYLIILISSNAVLNKKINPEEIKYVKLYDSEDYNYYGQASYAALMRKNIKFTDSEIKSLIAKGYENQAERAKNGEDGWVMGRTSTPFVIGYTDGSENVRWISLDNEDNAKLDALIQENSEWKEAALKLPEKCYIDCFNEKRHNEKIWDCFLKEYGKLSDEKKMLVKGLNRGESLGAEYSLGIVGYEGIKTYSDSLSIFSQIMPETYDLYAEFAYEENVDAFKKMEKYIKEGAPKEGGGSIELYVAEFGSEIYFSVEMTKKGAESVNVHGSYGEWIPEKNINATPKNINATPDDAEYYYEADNAEFYYYVVDNAEFPYHDIYGNLYGNDAKEFLAKIFECVDYEAAGSPDHDGSSMHVNYYSYSGFSSKNLNGNMNVKVDTGKLKEVLESANNNN